MKRKRAKQGQTAGKTRMAERHIFAVFCFLFALFYCAPVSAAEDAGTVARFDAKWGGHLKIRGQASFPPEDSPYRAVGPETFLDGSLEGRLKNTLFWGQRTRLDTHYEAIASGGDTRSADSELADLLGGSIPEALLQKGIPSDDLRLMNLTGVLREEDDFIVYHRLDRLALTVAPDWGTITAGRQAVTWGNGFLFNPMDLFNPFSPADIEREYKIGDDMLFVQVPVAGGGNLQALYVPRRDPVEGDISWEESSLAVKAHLFRGAAEFDLMAAKHYEDHVLGAGAGGYLGAAAWRMDVTWTLLDQSRQGEDYPSLVANVDYSWVWWGKNLYGFVEFFYSGLGEGDYRAALSDPELTERLVRGELFTLGKTYAAGYLRLEIHPLVNLFCTAILNTADPSGIIQPRGTWDITEDLQLLLGADLFWGPSGSEFGGIPIAGTPYTTAPADRVYAWLAYYF
jgi:hypothetical protein